MFNVETKLIKLKDLRLFINKNKKVYCLSDETEDYYFTPTIIDESEEAKYAYITKYPLIGQSLNLASDINQINQKQIYINHFLSKYRKSYLYLLTILLCVILFTVFIIGVNFINTSVFIIIAIVDFIIYKNKIIKDDINEDK